jgi:hypothetical protein
MDVYRAEDGSYHIEADLPRVDAGSVEVTVEHGTLTIRAERAPHYASSLVLSCRPGGSRSPTGNTSAPIPKRAPRRVARRRAHNQQWRICNAVDAAQMTAAVV